VRAAIPAVLTGLVLALLAPAAGPEVAPPPHDGPDHARDLKLVAAFEGKTVPAGTSPHVALTLVNTSKANTYLVVKPGDGSECGWREPHVYFTAEQLSAQRKWEPLQRYGLSRCGLYDFDWPKDVVELKPGEKLAVTNNWIPNPDFRLQFSGKVRVTGHYDYQAGKGKSGVVRAVENRGRMYDTPAFAIASNPVEFEVVRPRDQQSEAERARDGK